MWEIHVVEGLESGHVAVVPKVHHSLFDGASGVEVVASFLDTGPVPRVVALPGRPWRPEPIPTEAELIALAMSSLVRQPERAASVLRRTFGAVRDLAERNRRLREEDDVVPPPAPFRAPRTSLNGSISPHRRFAFVAGAPRRDPHRPSGLRRHRQRRRARVRGGSAASASGRAGRTARGVGRGHGSDVDGEVDADRGTLGNKVSAMLVALATQIADPVERYTTITAGTRLAKDQARVLSEELIQGWAQLAFPALSSRIARMAGNLRLFDHLPPLFNVLVSNIAGPDFALWCAGARLVALYPIGPIIEGVGLNVTVASYEGTLYFGILGCRELVPEVAHFGDLVTDAFSELLKAAERNGGHWA